MKKILGIELGSTRIKAVLINEEATVLAQGSYEWENKLVDGLWSYSLDDVERGLQQSYAVLAENYRQHVGEELVHIDAIGISAMMHGYLAFDKKGMLLTPFRTWRNTNTEAAADELTRRLCFNIPMRWSVSHYYQAVCNGEAHVRDVKFLTTLSGYVHYKLTGRRVLGIGDASGMFPVRDGTYDADMLHVFNGILKEHGINTPFESLLPEVLPAGECAGVVTKDGARWLDPSGSLQAGCILCPPEGDAGTGMVATNSVTPCTANVSAGTSAFLMAVLDHELENYYREIDVVATPSGAPVAMVHVNNFCSEITAWANLFEEVVALGGGQLSRGELFERLYTCSSEADMDLGGLLGYNFLAGEPIVQVASGVPMITRLPSGKLTLPNFMKMHIYSALGALAIGCEILQAERVHLDSVCGHGGFFHTPFIGQSAMSAAIGAPVTVMQNAGEGGAWGIALLALFAHGNEQSLERFLDGIFAHTEKTTVSASENERASFEGFMQAYKKGLAVQRQAADILHDM